MKLLKAIGLTGILAATACGGTSTDTKSVAKTDDTKTEAKSDIGTCPIKGEAACPAGTTANGANCEATGADLVTVSGVAQDFQSERALPGAVVAVLNNDTGAPTGVCGITDGAGKLNIKVPKGKKIGFSTSLLAEEAKDTYQFNLLYDTDSEEKFYSVSNITAQLIPGIIGEPLDPTKATVAGTVVNEAGAAITDTTGEYKVKTKSGQKAYYFNDGVPSSSEKKLNPDNALFVAFGLAPGKQELQLTYNGDVSEVTDNILFAFPDSIAISNIKCAACK
jgi:hypothetical protein